MTCFFWLTPSQRLGVTFPLRYLPFPILFSLFVLSPSKMCSLPGANRRLLASHGHQRGSDFHQQHDCLLHGRPGAHPGPASVLLAGIRFQFFFSLCKEINNCTARAPPRASFENERDNLREVTFIRSKRKAFVRHFYGHLSKTCVCAQCGRAESKAARRQRAKRRGALRSVYHYWAAEARFALICDLTVGGPQHTKYTLAVVHTGQTSSQSGRQLQGGGGGGGLQ